MTQLRNPSSAPAQSSDDRAWARPLFEQQIELLGELAEAGLAVAVAIKDQVAAGGGDLLKLANAYARVARAVRMAILLQSKLIHQLQDWDRQTAYDASRAAGLPQDARAAEVEKISAQRDREAAEHIERLVGEVAGRLDRDDIYDLVAKRPVSELIAMICQDLGLDPDWPRVTQEALAQKQAGGGSPFAVLTARGPKPSKAGAN